jgi:hypothetical protein
VFVACELAAALGALSLLVLAILRARTAERASGAGLIAALVCYAAALAGTIALERALAGDHPAPWLHSPLRSAVAELLVLAGLLGLATRAIARRWPWTGRVRFLAIAIALPLAIGTAWLAAGAAELAWVWLVPALAAALAPRSGRAAPIAIAATLLAPALVLLPMQLREAAWNGFLPPSLPLAAWLGFLLAPTFALVAWWSRRRTGPLGALTLTLGCTLAAATGAGLMIATRPACSAADYHRFHLACELQPTWR